MSSRSNTYVTAMAIAAVAVLAGSAWTWHCADPIRYFCYLSIALAASALRLSIPGITGSVTVNYLFVLIGVVELSFGECVVMACLSALSECAWRRSKKHAASQVIFNASVLTISGAGAWGIYHLRFGGADGAFPLQLGLASLVFFVLNTMAAAQLYAVEEQVGFWRAWRERHVSSLLHYSVAGCAVALIAWLNRAFGWEVALLILPVVLERMESERKHSGEMSALHLRTVQTLALAIEAKDENTAGHLERVRVYAVEVGKQMGLQRQDLSALEAAAILHDIGKLAVPEHIISKPGRLTNEEFDRMKMHPVIGAQILTQVGFPYPVVPIVRSHHERWDGTGYPDGISKEQIPIGARILAAVDCLDALASERQYRRALPLDEAMATVEKESGKSFDPAVVEVLKERYRELEQLARKACEQVNEPAASTELAPNARPMAGLEAPDSGTGVTQAGFLTSIAAARQEAQTLFELTQELGNSLSLHETLSVLAFRLKRLVPHDTITIYLKKGDSLTPEFVSGDDFRLFSSLEIPVGEGLSGWALLNRRTVLNSDPSLEASYLNDSDKKSILKSALVVPLDGVDGPIGVLALYAAAPESFTKDHVRMLCAVASKASLAIENAVRFQRAESIALVDALTGLLNARGLFLQLDSEIARAKRSGSPLTVLTGDLDSFRGVNARFGQQTGDRVLQEVARALRQVCREYDHVARMSADEFVMVVPGMSASGVDTLVARIGDAVRAAGARIYPGRTLTAAFGRAMYPQDGAEAEQLLAVADRMMYRSKKNPAEGVASEPGAFVLRAETARSAPPSAMVN